MTRLDSLDLQETGVFPAFSVHAKAVELARHIVRMTTEADSGHPSTALALCHIIVELMYRQMRYSPSDPWNPASDRLVLSIGHAVPVVYAAYADLGGAVGKDSAHAKKLTVADLAGVRALDSVLDGHPNPAEGFPFFDAATGSLGQGLSVAAGLACAARLDGLNKRIYVIAGDGESREGQVWEAVDFIVDQGLTNVCVVFSCNGHGQAGPVSTQQSAEAIAVKLRAFGWQVHEVDGHDPDALREAFAQLDSTVRPLAIVARTVKGWGVPSIQSSNYHGKPIARSRIDGAIAELNTTAERLGAGGATESMVPAVPSPPPSKALPPAGQTTLGSLEDALRRVGMAEALDRRTLATRAAYGAALVALGDIDDRIVALDGDVSNSTHSELFARFHSDRFFECKIAEQNMISCAAGLAAGGRIPFASSFAKFIARAVDQIDMASITRANIKIVGSHSGVSLAADGPSQMSLADVAYFRSMTRADDGFGRTLCHVFHPADAVCAYRCCELMANVPGLCYLRTHRPAAPILYSLDEAFGLRACKQLREGKRLTLVSSGYMLHSVLSAADRLVKQGVSCNVFDVYTFPLDSTPILQAASQSGGQILTVEDNYLGGLHAELAEAAARTGEVRLLGMTVRRVPKSARTAGEVFSHVGVGLDQIVAEALRLGRTPPAGSA